MPMSTIESAASAACGGVPLAKERALIGYSNGAKYAGEFSAQCGQNSEYSKFIVIGYPGAAKGNCAGMSDRYASFSESLAVSK